jgi:hypothetical protein
MEQHADLGIAGTFQALVFRYLKAASGSMCHAYKVACLGLIPAESNIVPFWETGQIAQWLNQANRWSVTVARVHAPLSSSYSVVLEMHAICASAKSFSKL